MSMKLSNVDISFKRVDLIDRSSLLSHQENKNVEKFFIFCSQNNPWMIFGLKLL